MKEESLVSWMVGRMDGWTDLSFFDTSVDGVQQVGSVLFTLREFGQFFPDQLSLVVAHHPLERWVHILERNQEGVTVDEWTKWTGQTHF